MIKHLNAENCKTPREEIHKGEEDTKGKISYVQTGRLNIVKMYIYSKASKDTMQFPSKFPSKFVAVFHKIRTNNTKICMVPQKTQTSQAILRKNKAEGIILFDC